MHSRIDDSLRPARILGAISKHCFVDSFRPKCNLGRRTNRKESSVYRGYAPIFCVPSAAWDAIKMQLCGLVSSQVQLGTKKLGKYDMGRRILGINDPASMIFTRASANLFPLRPKLRLGRKYHAKLGFAVYTGSS